MELTKLGGHLYQTQDRSVLALIIVYFWILGPFSFVGKTFDRPLQT